MRLPIHNRDSQGEFPPTPLRMCTYTTPPKPPSPNPFTFCRYKIPSHLHILELLKVPHFQHAHVPMKLTHLECADAKHGGWGLPAVAGRYLSSTAKSVVLFSIPVPQQNMRPLESARYALNFFQLLYSHAITHSPPGGYPPISIPHQSNGLHTAQSPLSAPSALVTRHPPLATHQRTIVPRPPGPYDSQTLPMLWETHRRNTR